MNAGKDTGGPDEAKVSRPVRREAVGKVFLTGQLAGGPPYLVRVLVEIMLDGDSYVLAVIALGTGNRLLRFRSSDFRLVYSRFEAQLSGAGGASIAA